MRGLDRAGIHRRARNPQMFGELGAQDAAAVGFGDEQRSPIRPAKGTVGGPQAAGRPHHRDGTAQNVMHPDQTHAGLTHHNAPRGRHRKADFDRFEAMIQTLDEVTLCIATGGGMDYVLHVFTPTLAAFQTLMETLLESEIGIDRYMTYIATRRIKSIQPNVAKLIAQGAN